DEQARHRERLARLRRRVARAERRAAASDAVRTQIVEELASLTERLRTPPDADALGDAVTGRAAQAATASPDRPPAAMPDGIPHRVRAAVAGRPCRLPT